MPEKPNMPNVTPGPIIALVTAVLGVIAAVGLPVSDELATAIVALAGALSISIPIIEAWLRGARLGYLVEHEKTHHRKETDK